jgi:FtsP/CotA-like multicopper oxidase with cupredoxin domain
VATASIAMTWAFTAYLGRDTVLVRTGQTVDILFDVTNPGLWMAHCHIAEHMQSGMMFSFTVARQPAAQRPAAQ